VVGPLASVVVPTFNGAHLLPECLDSLQGQSYAALEVVVADGASSDATVDMMARRYPGVRLLRLRRNGGFTANVITPELQVKHLDHWDKVVAELFR